VGAVDQGPCGVDPGERGDQARAIALASCTSGLGKRGVDLPVDAEERYVPLLCRRGRLDLGEGAELRVEEQLNAAEEAGVLGDLERRRLRIARIRRPLVADLVAGPLVVLGRRPS
jgi:hypothetical protein